MGKQLNSKKRLTTKNGKIRKTIDHKKTITTRKRLDSKRQLAQKNDNSKKTVNSENSLTLKKVATEKRLNSEKHKHEKTTSWKRQNSKNTIAEKIAEKTANTKKRQLNDVKLKRSY